MFKMLINYANFLYTHIVVVILLTIGFVNETQAGTCWVKRMESGKCKQPLSRNISRENCCSAGPTVGFTESDMNEFEYFFAMAIGDGTSCTSCIASCETAKCGNGKRCTIRNGEPKCICSPMCKSSKVKTTKSIVIDTMKTVRATNENRPNRTVKNTSNIINQRKSLNHHHHHNHHHYNRHQSEMNLNADAVIDIINNSTNSSSLMSDKLIATNSDSSSVNNNLNSNQFSDKEKHFFKIDNNFLNHKNKNFTKDVIMHHRNRHYRKKHRFPNDDGDNDRQSIIGWEEKIRSGLIGYDLPYPPNEFSIDERGPYYNPVCGSDGKTYKTECQLKKRACRQEITTLTVAYRGQCQTSCKKMQCPATMHCLEDQNLMPHCVTCTMKCPPYDNTAKSLITNPSKMVCGTDGLTYRNLCDIKRAACLAGRSIPVAYRGPCKDFANCNNIKCKDRQICLNDLITHRPRCVSCGFKCPRRRRPQGQKVDHMKICGTNNVTYYSWCQMMKDSCFTGFFIDTKYNGPCGDTVKNGSIILDNFSKS